MKSVVATIFAVGLLVAVEGHKVKTKQFQLGTPEPASFAATERVRLSDGSEKTLQVTEVENDAQISAGAAHYLVVIPPILGLLFSMLVYQFSLKPINLKQTPSGMDERGILIAGVEEDPEEAQDHTEIVHKMISISGFIMEGAISFMNKEFQVLGVVMVIIAAVIGYFISVESSVAFICGAVTSGICGYVGMIVACYSNVRCTHQCWHSLGAGFNTALLGGAVMGFSLVSIGVLSFYFTFCMLDYLQTNGYMANSSLLGNVPAAMCGFGLGGSTVALFARVGGGIYTKAADVGADLSGKNEYGMDEDDPRNPACIADNVGDNVGDIAGMGADLFGSFAESTCAAMFIWYAQSSMRDFHADPEIWPMITYPILISSLGILSSLVAIIICVWFLPTIKYENQVETRLKAVLLLSTFLQTPIIWFLGHYTMPVKFTVQGLYVSPMELCICGNLGLWTGMIIGLVTEYYTSHSYEPVREMSRAYKQSASTGLILGYALGFNSTVVPLLLIAATITICHSLCGMFGVALAGIGMLSTLCCSLTIDAYGPIADNAGGIAEMAGLGRSVRARTDCLDAAGNTTAAIGKGFAIGSAALVAVALFSAFIVGSRGGGEGDLNGDPDIQMLNPWVFLGLMIGSMLPFVFGAMLMTSVARAAQKMLEECFRQFPLIINEGVDPDYERCIAISTEASLREMIVPGLLVVVTPVLGGIMFGSNFTSGLLVGIMLSGLLLAIAMSNSGGAFDNAKKYIEANGLGDDIGKGSDAHKAAVIGDTLGDPLKDTSGPALNILLKLSAVASLTFCTLIKSYSHQSGDPLFFHLGHGEEPVIPSFPAGGQ